MKLPIIAQLLGAHPDSVPDTDIHWLLTDSRSLSFPSGTLFFALKTSRNDGHLYIAELYRQNLRYFVVSELHPDFETLTDNAVTVRERDSMKQERVPLAELEAYLSKELAS